MPSPTASSTTPWGFTSESAPLLTHAWRLRFGMICLPAPTDRKGCPAPCHAGHHLKATASQGPIQHPLREATAVCHKKLSLSHLWTMTVENVQWWYRSGWSAVSRISEFVWLINTDCNSRSGSGLCVMAGTVRASTEMKPKVSWSRRSACGTDITIMSALEAMCGAGIWRRTMSGRDLCFKYHALCDTMTQVSGVLQVEGFQKRLV